jgi:hypothetical protein
MEGTMGGFMTRSTIGAAAAAILALGLIGCGRYQIEGDGQGRIVRLDRLTGQVDYLQGTRFVRVENPGEHRREREELATVRDWGTSRYDLKYALRLKTAWRNGRMYYQLGITPQPPANIFNFRVALNDADGFQVANISLNTPDGTATPDSGIVYSGFALADEDVYRSIASWSPRVEFYSGKIAPAELPLP